uniref:Uncharacterized protein n=1 Tax=Anguilla anguilla TaxID=7936 RepID=A0A0E9UIU4_ANGAN
MNNSPRPRNVQILVVITVFCMYIFVH